MFFKEKIKQLKRALAGLALAAGLVGALTVGLSAEPVDVSAAGASYPITVNSSSIADDTTFSAYQWNWDGNDKTTIEVWYSIDQGTTNTTTIYLDASPDNSMWKTGYATVVSANAADATSYATATIVGRFFRIRADTTNTNTITPTIKVIYK
jgi:hypothetical protein